MKNKGLLITLALMAGWSIWLTVEVRKLGNVRREIADLQSADKGILLELAKFRTDIVAELDDLKSKSASLSLLRRAQRPATQLELNSLGIRMDILEGALRAQRTAGK